MGEAKRRGTEAQRKEKAIEGNANVTGPIGPHGTSHYAFILDRSPQAVEALKKLKSGPTEIKNRMASAAVQFWEESHFPYIVIWGTWGMTGGLTIPCLDVNSLLNEAIPAAMNRTLEKGGMCVFAPMVADDLVEPVKLKIAELQPTIGPVGVLQ